MKMRTLLVSAGLLTLAGAQAQISNGIGIRGGYYLGDRFDGLHLDGFELGADLTLFHLGLVDIRLSPTVVFGGSAAHGSDTDGNIYRITAGAKFSTPGQPWYGVVGTGFAATENRGGKQFDTTSGAIGQLTLGYNAGTKLGVLQTYYELSYFFGDSQLSGVAFDIGVKF
jgi:hypothetical protein